jgi:uncharacterized damage-inducible protein DinB
MLDELLLSKWEQVRAGLQETIDKFAAGDLGYRPFPNGYSVAELMLHIAHEEDIEVGYGLAGRLDSVPPAYESAAYPSIEAIGEALAASHGLTLAYLTGLTSADLEAETQTPWGSRARRIELLWHVLEHEIHHRAELSLILGLLGKRAGRLTA